MGRGSCAVVAVTIIMIIGYITMLSMGLVYIITGGGSRPALSVCAVEGFMVSGRMSLPVGRATRFERSATVV